MNARIPSPEAWSAFRSYSHTLNAQIEVPLRPSAKGTCQGGGWSLQWVWTGMALECLAEHRQTNLRRRRFRSDGLVECPDEPRESFPQSPADLGGSEAAEAAWKAWNHRVWQEIHGIFGASNACDFQGPEPGQGDVALEQPANPFTLESYEAFLRELEDLLSQRGSFQLGGQAVPSNLNRRAFHELPEAYRRRLPRYRLAHCPFCYRDITEPIDTWSLAGPGWWREESQGWGWFGRPFASPDTNGSFLSLPFRDEPSWDSGCPHLSAIHYGVSLGGRSPETPIPNYVWLGSPRPRIPRIALETPDLQGVLSSLRGGASGKTPFLVWFAAVFDRRGAQMVLRRRFQADECTTDLEALRAQQRLYVLRGHILDSDQAPLLSLRDLEGRWCLWGGRPRLLPESAEGRALLQMQAAPFKALAQEEARRLREGGYPSP